MLPDTGHNRPEPARHRHPVDPPEAEPGGSVPPALHREPLRGVGKRAPVSAGPAARVREHQAEDEAQAGDEDAGEPAGLHEGPGCTGLRAWGGRRLVPGRLVRR